MATNCITSLNSYKGSIDHRNINGDDYKIM